jgi:hypothetical protein
MTGHILAGDGAARQVVMIAQADILLVVTNHPALQTSR